MPRFGATFTRCEKCGRLLTVDALNPFGKCTKECREALTGVEKRLGARAVVMAIRRDGFPVVEIHIFSDYARKVFPDITREGITELFRAYQTDPNV